MCDPNTPTSRPCARKFLVILSGSFQASRVSISCVLWLSALPDVFNLVTRRSTILIAMPRLSATAQSVPHTSHHPVTRSGMAEDPGLVTHAQPTENSNKTDVAAIINRIYVILVCYQYRGFAHPAAPIKVTSWPSRL